MSEEDTAKWEGMKSTLSKWPSMSLDEEGTFKYVLIEAAAFMEVHTTTYEFINRLNAFHGRTVRMWEKCSLEKTKLFKNTHLFAIAELMNFKSAVFDKKGLILPGSRGGDKAVGSGSWMG